MKRTSSLTQQYISSILLISLFLQSCGGGFDNNPLMPIKEKQSECFQADLQPIISLSDIEPLIMQELTAEGGYLITPYEYKGKLQASVEVADEKDKVYNGIPIKIEEGIDLASLPHLPKKVQAGRIHIQKTSTGKPARVVIYKEAGLMGGMEEDKKEEAAQDDKGSAPEGRRSKKARTDSCSGVHQERGTTSEECKGKEIECLNSDEEEADEPKELEKEEYSDSEKEEEDEYKPPHFNNVYNFTKNHFKSNPTICDNYIPEKEESFIAKNLADDARKIKNYARSKGENKLTVLCVALKHRNGRVKKFVFTSRGFVLKCVAKEAHKLNYHVIQTQQSHAEGGLMQFLQERPNRYEIIKMGCSQDYCSLCKEMLTRYLNREREGYTYNPQNIEGLGNKLSGVSSIAPGPNDNWYIPLALRNFFSINRGCFPIEAFKECLRLKILQKVKTNQTPEELEKDFKRWRLSSGGLEGSEFLNQLSSSFRDILRIKQYSATEKEEELKVNGELSPEEWKNRHWQLTPNESVKTFSSESEQEEKEKIEAIIIDK